MKNNQKMSKQSLRQEMRQRKKTYGSEQLRRMSQPIIEALLAHPRLMSAHTILLYASLADEVNTHELINTLLQQGKTLLLPVVVDDHTMKSKHPTLAAFVWASSFTTFARKTLCLYSTKQMFFGFVALQ